MACKYIYISGTLYTLATFIAVAKHSQYRLHINHVRPSSYAECNVSECSVCDTDTDKCDTCSKDGAKFDPVELKCIVGDDGDDDDGGLSSGAIAGESKFSDCRVMFSKSLLQDLS